MSKSYYWLDALELTGVYSATQILIKPLEGIKVAFNMKVFLVIALFWGLGSAEDKPNYLTDEEFAQIDGQSIPVSNTSALSLPKFEERIQARPGFGRSLWTNAQVPYILDPNFNSHQREQVALAIKQYHDNTCIRFIPKQNNHRSWVSIELDDTTCGVAHMCMNSGGQWAKFGGSCVSAGVMTHELGHTLCMGHEQTRRDRDEWIDWDTSKCQPHGKDGDDMTGGLHKLYDYVSIEHYEGECYNGCIRPKVPGVTKCGSGGPLSVLDIEVLNEMYGCNGNCLGYRWVNHNRELKNPIRFGTDSDGSGLYSCRAYHQGDIVPGKYHPGRRECYVAYNGGEHKKTGNYIEVLTNPHDNNLQWVRSSSRPGNAIRGGRTNEREAMYAISCQLDNGGQWLWTPGKHQPSAGSYASWGGAEKKCDIVEWLVCS